jgi:uncharacterized protein (TIGR02217 family)
MPDLIIISEDLALGFKSAAGGFNTSVITGGGGYEYRNQNWSAPRRRFEFSYLNKDQDEIQAIMAFVDDRRGALHPWLLKDWGNYTLTDELILSASAGQTTAQIKQTWGTNNSLAIDRKHIKSGTLIVKKNAVTQTLTTHYTVDSLGLITFTAPLSSGSPADAITVTCEFYHKVRFEADIYQPSIDGPEGRYGTFGSISAIEVR